MKSFTRISILLMLVFSFLFTVSCSLPFLKHTPAEKEVPASKKIIGNGSYFVVNGHIVQLEIFRKNSLRYLPDIINIVQEILISPEYQQVSEFIFNIISPTGIRLRLKHSVKCAHRVLFLFFSGIYPHIML